MRRSGSGERVDLDRVDRVDDHAVDRDPRELGERLERCAVEAIAVLEVALRGGAVEADETVRVVEHEAAHHGLGIVGLELVTCQGVDGEEAPPQLRFRERVGDDVSVLARDVDVGVADPDDRLEAFVDHVHVGGRVW